MAGSALWIVGAAAAIFVADIRAARLVRNAAFEACDYVGRYLAYGDCWRDLMRLAARLDGVFADLALFALAPVALAWLAVRLVMIARRRSRAGGG